MAADYDRSAFPWLEVLRIDTIPVLMDAAPLHIRYQLLPDVLNDGESNDFKDLKKNLRKQKDRRLLFAKQDQNGCWPLSGKTKGLAEGQLQTLQFIQQIEALHALVDLMVTEKQEKALLGMREVIRFLDKDHPPLRLHQLSQAIYLSIALKLDGNPIIKNLIWDLLKNQHSDGSWSSLPSDQDSCLWTTLFFLWTMGHSEQFKNNRTLRKGLKYLEDHLLVPDQSKLLPGMQAWDTLLSGHAGLSVLHGGTLRYLETYQMFNDNERNRKIEKLVDWLVSVQLKNGLWPAIVGRDKRGNFEVTLRALKVVKHFEGLRINDTIEYTE
ncbi:MAG: hypothetical protein K9M49_09870 [Candidatus Marinimicrobia bacterium]|nr:hypothetical protein [Candidatus Neomarinimicrobiota bacterium]